MLLPVRADHRIFFTENGRIFIFGRIRLPCIRGRIRIKRPDIIAEGARVPESDFLIQIVILAAVCALIIFIIREKVIPVFIKFITGNHIVKNIRFLAGRTDHGFLVIVLCGAIEPVDKFYRQFRLLTVCAHDDAANGAARPTGHGRRAVPLAGKGLRRPEFREIRNAYKGGLHDKAHIFRENRVDGSPVHRKEIGVDQSLRIKLIHDLQIIAEGFPIGQRHDRLSVSQAYCVGLGICPHISHCAQNIGSRMLRREAASDGVFGKPFFLKCAHGVDELIQRGRNLKAALLQPVIVNKEPLKISSCCGGNISQRPDISRRSHNNILQLRVFLIDSIQVRHVGFIDIWSKIQKLSLHFAIV